MKKFLLLAFYTAFVLNVTAAVLMVVHSEWLLAFFSAIFAFSSVVRFLMLLSEND